ncbi:hypothetical protein Psuf_014010 [Phytohabitans suffuscus]|uniref:RNase H type-1 domain-containing protein n=1 Tax=Phytohabitans suffuscus TaxID=624315 RepID=A0A6F8YDN8_9ACTN|nr:hypothetical protein Psuf_014010 [Phytohabitans suffuscus]
MTVSALRVVVEADGGARGNPGPAGYGAVVRDANSSEVLAERAEALGIATNNVAEYSGLLAGLRAAADLGASEVEVRMDSKLVVEQMSGRWQIKNPGLRPLAAQAATLMRRFDLVTYVWVPRERNKHADALANRAMDEAAGLASGARGGVRRRERRSPPPVASGPWPASSGPSRARAGCPGPPASAASRGRPGSRRRPPPPACCSCATARPRSPRSAATRGVGTSRFPTPGWRRRGLPPRG